MQNKILVVDDEEFILELFETAFSSKGYCVFTTMDPSEALKLFDEENIKVVFMDINMPVMSGLDLCREIRRRDTEAQLIAVTGSPTTSDRLQCMEAGFNSFYTKPIALNDLYNAAKNAFERI